MSETLELFEAVPIMHSNKEKLLTFLIRMMLSFGHIIIALLVWIDTSWYIALSTLLLGYLVMGIVSSKIVHFYIPARQREFNYSNKELAAWIIAYYRNSTP